MSSAVDRFAAAFDEHAPGLWRYLARQAGPAVAEDLVAETFLAAWRQRGDYRAELGSLRAWLYGIATNLMRRHHRTEAQQQRMADRLAGRRDDDTGDGHDRADDRLDARIHLRELAAAIAALGDGDREVLLLSSLAELDHREISVALGIPEGTVRSRLHRVRRTLRAALPATRGES
jgi:RNA polymerase sigma-70 factor (ECF subfamily)